MSRKITFAALAALIPFGFSLALDRALGWFGVPAEAEEYAHPVGPPNYSREVDFLEYRYTLRTNRFGLRSPETTLEKPPGVKRVVLLGDSYTEGAGAADGERWSDLLGPLLAERGCRVEAINCAESGTGPADYLRAFAGLCAQFQPDLVLTGVFQNDVWDTAADDAVEPLLEGRPPRSGPRRALHALWPHSYTLLRRALYPPRPDEPEALLDWLEAQARRRGASEARIARWRAAVPPEWARAIAADRMFPAPISHPLIHPGRQAQALDLSTSDARARWEKALEMLAALTREAERGGARAVVMYIPERTEYEPASHTGRRAELSALMGAPFDRRRLVRRSALERSLESWAAEREAGFLSLTEGLRRAEAESDEQLTYEVDAHWNALGNRAVAELIAARLAPELGCQGDSMVQDVGKAHAVIP